MVRTVLVVIITTITTTTTPPQPHRCYHCQWPAGPGGSFWQILTGASPAAPSLDTKKTHTTETHKRERFCCQTNTRGYNLSPLQSLLRNGKPLAPVLGSGATPGQTLEPILEQPGTLCLCPGWGTWLLLSHLQVEPVVRLSTYRRHRTITVPATQTATDMALPPTAPTYSSHINVDTELLSTTPMYRTHIKCKHKQPSSLLLFSWSALKVTSEGTRTTLSSFISTSSSVAPPSTGTSLLSVWRSCTDPELSYLSHSSPTWQLAQPEVCW